MLERAVGQNCCFSLPVEASQCSLDVFEKPPLLITFDTSFEQKIGPVFAPIGPTLEFEFAGNRTFFLIDLQNFYLEIQCKIAKPGGIDMAYDASTAANSDSLVFLAKTSNSVFPFAV